jgi:hypothetical protein
VHAVAAEQSPARVSRDPGHSQPDRVRGSLLLTRQAGPATGTTTTEAGVLVRKLSQLTRRSAKLSGLTPGISYCSLWNQL